MANKKKPLLIFEIEYAGELNWIAHYSMIEALQFYCKETGTALNDFDGNDHIGQLKKEVWKDYKVNPEKGTGERGKNFYTAIKQLKEPDWIASMEY